MIWIKSTISGILDRPFWPLILMVFPWKLIIRQKEVKSWFSTQWCCRLCWSCWSGSCLAQYFINFLFGRLNKRALFFWKKFILIEICGTEDQRTVSGILGKICLWIRKDWHKTAKIVINKFFLQFFTRIHVECLKFHNLDAGSQYQGF